MTAECAVGLCRDARHRYYWNGDGPLVSVTTVTSIVDKSGPLMWWASGLAAEAAIDMADQIPSMLSTSGRQATIDFLRRAADKKKRDAGDMGTRIHSIAETIIAGNEFTATPEEAPFVQGIYRFLDDRQVEPLLTEQMVASLHYGYAGTFDLIARIDGETWLLDWKTSKSVYREYSLQLAAYGNAEFIGRPNEPKKYKLPDIERYGVVHVRPDKHPGSGYELVEMTVGDSEWAAFRFALGLHRWVNEEKKS